MKYIMLSTMHSTGTWWVIDALRKHPEIGGISHVQNLMNLQNDWVLRDGWTGNPHNEALAPEGKTTLLYCHYAGMSATFNRWTPQGNYEFLMTVVPTLSSLRDPLLCMIRAWHREPPLYPYDWLMDAWMHIAKRGDTLAVKYWRMEPFDEVAFIETIAAVGLSCPIDWITGLDSETRINDTPGECDLRDDYRNGDIAALKRKLPVPWRRLKEGEPILRPFLESHGFTDLLWWS